MNYIMQVMCWWQNVNVPQDGNKILKRMKHIFSSTPPVKISFYSLTTANV